MKIKINKSMDDLLATYAVGMLKDFYLNEKEDSPQQAYARAATAWSTYKDCLLYTSPSPRDVEESRMPSSA